MSLDVYLRQPGAVRIGTGIYYRERGQTKELTRAEWDARVPGREPIIADDTSEDVYSANITHNLGKMAEAAGIYMHLWRPEEIGITKAVQLTEPLRAGLSLLRSEPARFKEFNPENGWGTYESLVYFVESYLEACEQNPAAIVSVSR